MTLERGKLHDCANDFFDFQMSSVMVLTPSAAVEVCLAAAQRGFVIARVEGGIWHDPGFEPRVNCIWDGADPPIVESAAESNNIEAANFIRKEGQVHSGFVITSPMLTAWPHKQE